MCRDVSPIKHKISVSPGYFFVLVLLGRIHLRLIRLKGTLNYGKTWTRDSSQAEP